MNKFWISVPSDELFELDGEPLVADESVLPFDALVEFASPVEFGSPFETVELSSRISTSNAPLPRAGELLLEPVAAVLVGTVLVLSAIENDN